MFPSGSDAPHADVRAPTPTASSRARSSSAEERRRPPRDRSERRLSARRFEHRARPAWPTIYVAEGFPYAFDGGIARLAPHCASTANFVAAVGRLVRAADSSGRTDRPAVPNWTGMRASTRTARRAHSLNPEDQSGRPDRLREALALSARSHLRPATTTGCVMRRTPTDLERHLRRLHERRHGERQRPVDGSATTASTS